jgi:EXLDI family protein
MPNRTIYVSDEDQWLFDRAQELNGGNLSSAIARALHRFVAIKEAQMKGFEEITVRVGRGGARRYKRFVGRRVARWRHHSGDRNRYEIYTVYVTRKDNYAVHTKVRGAVDWRDPETWLDPEVWSFGDWKPGGTWFNAGDVLRGDVFPGGDATLDVYATLDELTANVPPELGDIVREAEQEPEVETLDI